MANYKVQVDTDYEFEISDEEIQALDTVKSSESAYHLIYENTSYHTEIVSSNFLSKRYVVKINSNSYEINIADDLDQLIDKLGFSIGAAKNINTIKAPMPGLILEIQVKQGDTVKEGDFLLVLEAMKMENVITSPRDGVIKSVTANSGDAVDKGKVLIEFE